MRWPKYWSFKPFNNTVIQVYATIINTEEAEVEWFYDYMVEVMDKLKELDLVDRVPEEVCMKVCNFV